MARVNIGDGSWFDDSKAEIWNEATDWDGRNHISRATGSQWEHERLYRTAKGTWLLYVWSAWQGSRARFSVLDERDAHAWLLRNDHVDAVPSTVVAQAEV